MSTKLYLVRTHKIEITNIFTALLTKTVADTFYYPCDYSLLGKFITNTIGKFTADFPHPNIRHIVWNDQTDATYYNYLETCLEAASKQAKIVGIGCHDDSSVLYLAKKYRPYVVTAGVYHTQQHHCDLLKHAAEYHVNNLKTSQTIPSQFDLELIQQLTTQQLIDYYAAAFEKQNLVDKSSNPVCDFNIEFNDLFDKFKVQNFFNSMNLSFNGTPLEFYDSWVSQYPDL